MTETKTLGTVLVLIGLTAIAVSLAYTLGVWWTLILTGVAATMAGAVMLKHD